MFLQKTLRGLLVLFMILVTMVITTSCRSLLPAENDSGRKSTSSVSSEPSSLPEGSDTPSSTPITNDAPSDSLSGTPLPNPPVITAVPGVPVAEINAKWAREVRVPRTGFVEGYKDGGFAVIAARDISVVFDELEKLGNEDYWDKPPRRMDKFGALSVSRYDPTGKLLWEKRYDGLSDVIHRAKTLSDGSLLVVTYRAFEISNIIYFESFADLSKIDADGTLRWTKKLSKNLEYMDDFLETENGEFYAYGLYEGNTDFVKKQSSASEPWFWVEDHVSSWPTLTHYDRDGNLLGSCLPDVRLVETADSWDSSCNVGYKKGVGLIADFGMTMICYDETLKPRWRYDYKDVVPYWEESPNVHHYSYDSAMSLGEDGVTVVASNLSSSRNLVRTLNISYDGRLIGKKESAAAANGYNRPYSLPGGRIFTATTTKKGKYKLTLSFMDNGKETVFDQFETGLALSSDVPVVPTDDGGFFLRMVPRDFSGGHYDPPQVESDYLIVTKYSREGKTEYQRVYQKQQAFPLSSGVIVVL